MPHRWIGIQLQTSQYRDVMWYCWSPSSKLYNKPINHNSQAYSLLLVGQWEYLLILRFDKGCKIMLRDRCLFCIKAHFFRLTHKVPNGGLEIKRLTIVLIPVMMMNEYILLWIWGLPPPLLLGVYSVRLLTRTTSLQRGPLEAPIAPVACS